MPTFIERERYPRQPRPLLGLQQAEAIHGPNEGAQPPCCVCSCPDLAKSHKPEDISAAGKAGELPTPRLRRCGGDTLVRLILGVWSLQKDPREMEEEMGRVLGTGIREGDGGRGGFV